MQPDVDAEAHEQGVVIVVVLEQSDNDYDNDNDNDNEGSPDGIFGHHISSDRTRRTRHATHSGAQDALPQCSSLRSPLVSS